MIKKLWAIILNEAVPTCPVCHGTDDEVTAELEAMGVDVEGAKKRFEETIKKCKHTNKSSGSEPCKECTRIAQLTTDNNYSKWEQGTE